jgi:hypothetical protein
MKKILFIIYIVLTSTAISHAQVGIGTDKPKGALDLTPETGTAKWGLVLPTVGAVDTVRKVINATGGTRDFPQVTTPGSAFTSWSIYDDEGNATPEFLPAEEAPAGTIVYDLSKDGIRVKRTGAGEINGDWTVDKLVDSSAVDKSVRYNLFGGTDFRMVDVSAGYNWSVGISADDSLVYATGSNGYYRTGMGRNNGNTQTWTLILSSKAKQVSAGYYHGAALLKNGDVYVWGYNNYGRTGRGTTSGSTQLPTKININLDAGDQVIEVEAGYQNTLFLTKQGKVYVTGSATRAMLGNGLTSGNRSIPQRINFSGLNTGETIKKISLAARGACVVTSEGRVFVWGNTNNGRLGQGSTGSNNILPTLINIPGGVKIADAVIGVGSGLAISADSLHLYHWGRNTALGGTVAISGFPSIQATPSTIPAWESRLSGGVLPNGEKIISIASPRHRDGDYYGDSHFVLTTETVYASGTNTTYGTNPGKLGVINLATGAALSPAPPFTEIQDHAIYEDTRFTKASIGYTHAFIMTGKIKNDDIAQTLAYRYYTTYNSGYNYYYQLGAAVPTAGTRVYISVKK